jgi:predicted PurR-regulated permease PerM
MQDADSAPWWRRLITVVLLGGLVLLGARVMHPFIVPIVWAAILAYVSWPAYRWLEGRCRNRELLAASIMTLVVSAAVIVPIAWLAVVLRLELLTGYHDLHALLAGGLQLPPPLARLPWIGPQLQELVTRLGQDPQSLGTELQRLTDHSFTHVTRIVEDIGRNLVKLAFAVLSLFFVFRGGEVFAAQVTSALEKVLGPRVDNYLRAVGQTVRAVVYGLGLSALAQGALVGLGYWIAGVHSPIFLAALTVLAGVVPFAVPLLLAAICVWLFLTGSPVAAVGLGIWGGLVVFCTDHFVRPVLIARGAKIPFIVVLFGVLGGIAAFGLVGLFIGPVILAVLLAVWREWLHESGAPGARL